MHSAGVEDRRTEIEQDRLGRIGASGKSIKYNQVESSKIRWSLSASRHQMWRCGAAFAVKRLVRMARVHSTEEKFNFRMMTSDTGERDLIWWYLLYKSAPADLCLARYYVTSRVSLPGMPRLSDQTCDFARLIKQQEQLPKFILCASILLAGCHATTIVTGCNFPNGMNYKSFHPPLKRG